jgi:hypothetical protein
MGEFIQLTEEIKYLFEMLTLLYDILAVQIAKYVKVGSHTGFLFISILKYLLLIILFSSKSSLPLRLHK